MWRSGCQPPWPYNFGIRRQYAIIVTADADLDLPYGPLFLWLLAPQANAAIYRRIAG